MEIIREGYWICPSCNSKNKGGDVTCPACGAIRGEVEFFYDEGGEEITDEAEKKKALSGPDWVCSYCGVSNSFGVQVCKGCSAQKGEGKNREVKDVLLHGGAPKGPPPPPPSPHASRREASFPRPQGSLPPMPSLPPVSVPRSVKFGCMAFVLLFAVLMVFEMMDYPQTLEVVGRNWERSVGIDEYRTVSEGDWIERVPSRGRIFNRTRKIRSYKQVLTGYKTVNETYTVREKVGTRRVKTGVTNLGNGRFKETYSNEPVYESRTRTRTVEKPQYRSDPIYDTYADYYLDKWIEIETPKISGTEEEPTWPDRGLPDRAPDTVGQKRIDWRKELYQVTFQSLKDQAKFTEKELNKKPIDFPLFKRLRLGTKWEAVVSGLGNLKELKIPISGPAETSGGVPAPQEKAR